MTQAPPLPAAAVPEAHQTTHTFCYKKKIHFFFVIPYVLYMMKVPQVSFSRAHSCMTRFFSWEE